MFTRNVFMKFKEDFQSEAEVFKVQEETTQVFEKLSMVRDFRIELPADEKSKIAWDLSLTVRFETLDDIDRYSSDESHRSYVDDFLKPRLEVIKAWNFT